MKCSHEVDEAKAQQHGDDAHDDTHLRHILLLHIASGEGQGVWRGGDRQNHRTRSGNGNADKDGGRATDGVELIAHSTTDNGEDRHEQRCRGRVGNEVAEQIADGTAEQQDEQGRELAEGDALHRIGSQSRGIESVAKSEATSHHPDDRPVDLFKVALVDNACQCKHTEGNHSHGVGVDAGDAVEQPEQYGDEECDDDDIAVGILLHLTVDMQFDGLLSEGEHLQQQAPTDEQQDDDQREHKHHPLTEAQSEVQSLRVVEILQRDGVWRGADRRTHTAQVGSHRNRHGQGDAAFTLWGQLAEHRREEGEHHSGSGRIADEHREEARDEQEAQQHHLAACAEGFEQHARQLRIESGLRSSDGQHETADEQHDDGVGKRGHHALIREQRSHRFGVHHRQNTTIGGKQQHHHDDGNRRSPRRHHLEHPHQSGEGEDSDDTLLDHGEVVDAKPFRGHAPEEEGDEGNDADFQESLESVSRVVLTFVTQFAGGIYEMSTQMIISHFLLRIYSFYDCPFLPFFQFQGAKVQNNYDNGLRIQDFFTAVSSAAR